MGTLEIFIWVSCAAAAYLYMVNRVRSAVRQIKFEDAVRKAVEEAKQKQKIDLLYGREGDD